MEKKKRADKVRGKVLRNSIIEIVKALEAKGDLEALVKVYTVAKYAPQAKP